MERQWAIDRLTEEDMEESMSLSEFAFQYTRTEQERMEARQGMLVEPADRWIVRDGERLAAQATVLELHTYIAGKPFAMGGVAGVATWPEYRRQGLVGKLLAHALGEMRSKGQTLSFLHPFAFAFYRKFGWETFTDLKHYRLTLTQLPPRRPYEGRIERVARGEYEKLYAIYTAYAEAYNGSLVRSELWWERRIARRKPGHIVRYIDVDGKAQGYLIYEVKDKEFVVHELVALNEEGRLALWSFIGQHDSMIDQVKLSAPDDDTLTDMLHDPRIKQELQPYFMARIVDVAAVLERYPFLVGCDESVRLQVRDEHAPWNEGNYTLEISASGQCRVTRGSSGLPDGEGIHLDIGALTMIMLGYRKGEQLSRSKRIQGDIGTINRLQNRIPERTTYLPDFF